MRRRRLRRGGFVLAVAALTLTLAGLAPGGNARRASPGYAPTVLVSGAAGTLTIHFTQAQADDPTAKLVFYAPLGIVPDLTATPGTTIGAVTASASAADLGSAALKLTGTIVVRGAADSYLSGGAQVPLATTAAACTGIDVHTTFWVLVLSTAGQTLELPLFVDAVAADSPAATFASATIQACLPPPDVPAGTPGRATFGVKVLDASIGLRNVFPPQDGEQRWRMTGTPYTPGTGAANAAATVETQSLVRQPTLISFTAKGIKGKARARVSGVVTEGGRPVAGAVVKIICQSVLATVRTDQSGRFRATVGVGTPTDVLYALATVATRSLATAGCTPTFTAQAIPCLNATVAGFKARSRKITVRT